MIGEKRQFSYILQKNALHDQKDSDTKITLLTVIVVKCTTSVFFFLLKLFYCTLFWIVKKILTLLIHLKSFFFDKTKWDTNKL